jgi:shikimate kinase
MPDTIILIGPQRAGKTSAGTLLAERLGQPFVDAGRQADRLLEGQGHSVDEARRGWSQGGLEGFLRYQAPFDTLVVERVVAEPAGVIELGAFMVAQDDPALFERIRQALAPFQHVVLLLPSPDAEASIRTLDERGRLLVNGMEINELFVRHHSNHDLARIRVYTNGKTPEATRDEIIAQLDPSSPDVLLIGPINAGKSTLGKLLAERLGRPQRSLDDLRWAYYKEIGFDLAEQQAAEAREGFAGIYRYWKRFELHAVERALQDHPGSVIDFGAGHSVEEDELRFARLKQLLAPYPNVVLVLPSPDLDESVATLAERSTLRVGGVPVTRYLVTHPAFSALARHTVYTDGRTPEQTSAEIAAIVSPGAS